MDSLLLSMNVSTIVVHKRLLRMIRMLSSLKNLLSSLKLSKNHTKHPILQSRSPSTCSQYCMLRLDKRVI